MCQSEDNRYMRTSLLLARKAAQKDEVPVGAVIVHEGKIVGRGFNKVESKKDASLHAEMVALRQAAKKLDRWRLSGCTMYVTLEPCAMCAGAMVLARIDRLVYAASDPKAGACGSLFNISEDKRLNHRIRVDRGVMEAEASKLLKDFFKKRRVKK